MQCHAECRRDSVTLTPLEQAELRSQRRTAARKPHADNPKAIHGDNRFRWCSAPRNRRVTGYARVLLLSSQRASSWGNHTRSSPFPPLPKKETKRGLERPREAQHTDRSNREITERERTPRRYLLTSHDTKIGDAQRTATSRAAWSIPPAEHVGSSAKSEDCPLLECTAALQCSAQLLSQMSG